MTVIPGTNLDIYPINLGGNTFGWTSDKEISFAVLDAFLEAGGNFIDTADSYSQWADGNPGGISETIIGEWIAERGNRDKVILATKVGGMTTRPGLAYDNVSAALDESLARLQTTYVDIYYAHYDDDAQSIEEQVRTGHKLVESGRVKYLALSNYTPERMREYFEVATREGLTVPVAIQPQYNLIHRKEYEDQYAKIASDFGVAVFSFFSLASGVLTGKYRTKADFEGKARAIFASDLLTDDALTVIEALDEVSKKRSVELTTVALAWLRAKGVTAPIASASSPEQLGAIMAAGKLELTEDEVATLDEASKAFA